MKIEGKWWFWKKRDWYFLEIKIYIYFYKNIVLLIKWVWREINIIDLLGWLEYFER